MVNIGTVKAGSISYYLESETLKIDEYYSAQGQEQGLWMGLGAREFKLGAAVDSEHFIDIMNGRRPGSDEALSPYFDRRKVLGIDVVFRAPKSVSLMLAVTSDATIRNEIAIAHSEATSRALVYLEARVMGGREGKGGITKVSGSGAIGSTWRHITSRAGDPLLHTHVVLANMLHSETGKWVTLDSRRIYMHAKTLGHLYQAELRRELTARLGVEWGEIKNGCADIVGIERDVIQHFSKRREEVERDIQAKIDDPTSRVNSKSGGAMQKAALETRRRKQMEPNEHAFERWRDEAAAIGFGDPQVQGACGRVQLALPEIDKDTLFAELSERGGVTAKRATFTRLHVVNEVASRVPAAAGADLVEELTDEWIDQFAVQLEPHEMIFAGNYKAAFTGEPALTTVAILEAEHELVSSSVGRINAGIVSPPEKNVDRLITRTSAVRLNDGQHEMVRRVLMSGSGVDLVVGDAGTGKTTALGTLRVAYEKAHFKIVGAALSHAAKDELQQGAGIDSRTLAAICGDIARGDLDRAFPGGERTVLVVDEAAMVDTWQMGDVLAAASRVGAKVVLVGDSKQLPAIGPGGWFDLLEEQMGASRLTENMRQQDPVEREIVDAMAQGKPEEAFQLAMDAKKIVECGDTEDAAREIVDEIAELGPDVSWMVLAGTNFEADCVNVRCQKMRYFQRFGKPRPLTGMPAFDVGDDVMFRVNDRELGVTNRDRGTVKTVNAKSGEICVQLRRNGELVKLPASFAENDELFALGYAATVHRGQGATVDYCYLLAGQSLSQEQIYVGISRGRKSNRVFGTGDWLENEAGFGESLERDAHGRIRRNFSRSAVEGAASTIGTPAPHVQARDSAVQAELAAKNAASRGRGRSF